MKRKTAKRKLAPKALRAKKRTKKESRSKDKLAQAARITVQAAEALERANALVKAALHGESLALEHAREVKRDK